MAEYYHCRTHVGERVGELGANVRDQRLGHAAESFDEIKQLAARCQLENEI